MPEFEHHVDVTWRARTLVWIPEGNPSSRDGFPVVLALHGYSESGARLRERLLALETGRFAVIYPDGPFPLEVREAGEPARVGHAWYQYTGDQDAFRNALAFARDYLERVLEKAAREHPLDRSKVALLGYSQGGYVAGSAALLQPSRFQALIAIATRIKLELVEDPEAARELRVLVVHGRRDRAIAFERQMEMVKRLREAGVSVEVLPHEGGHGLKSGLAGDIRRFLDCALGAGEEPRE